MRNRMQAHRKTVMFVVGASLIALCVAARRLGLGTAVDGGLPSPWLALMFLVGAVLVGTVLLERLIEIIRKR